MEFIVDGDFVGYLELPFLDLMEEFNHDRDFHGAGGVEGVVGVIEEFGFAVEGEEGDAYIGVGSGDAIGDLSLNGSGEIGLGDGG